MITFHFANREATWRVKAFPHIPMEIVPERNRLEKRQLCGVVLESNFLKPLSEGNNFRGRLRHFGRSLRWPLSRLVLGDVLANMFEESQLWGNSFGEELWAHLCGATQGTVLGRSVGEQL